MQKPKIPVLIVMTSVFILLLTGFFYYRNYSRDCIVPTEAVSQKQADNKRAVRETNEIKININTATAKQLQLLPGIGEVIAQRIVDYRTESGPFKSVDDLLNVSGIGDAKLEQLKPYAKVE